MRIKKDNIKDLLIAFAIVFTGILFLSFFKIKHSMTFMNLDELLWMFRSRFFMDGILSLDFSNLIQSSHPGIMVMWAVGPFMEILNYDFNSIAGFIKDLNASGVGYNVINERNQELFDNYREISFLFNIPILTTIFLFIFSLYYLLRKLAFNKWAVIFSVLLVVTTPYYIYFTTPTDKFVGISSILSLLSLLVYSSGKGGKKFLVFSAALGSWAALTKMSALFLIPFSLFVLVFYKLNLVSYFCRDEALLRLYGGIKNIIKDYTAWIIVFFSTSVIFLPTIISNPRSVINLMTKESSQRIITENHSVFFSFNVAFAYFSDTFALSFNLFVIIIFFGFLLLIIRRISNKMNVSSEILVLTIYLFSFFAFVVLFSKTYSFRYVVPALIVFQIISGIGIYEFANIFIKRNNITDKKLIYSWAVVFILISQGLLIYYSEIERIESLPYFG
ncbi:MAG: hypothetical protein KAU07_00130 [Candidatus Andersenbacteria bacterium]|nr:hypothetical protein [Candidatus Andersenbacteria bacterium]